MSDMSRNTIDIWEIGEIKFALVGIGIARIRFLRMNYDIKDVNDMKKILAIMLLALMLPVFVMGKNEDAGSQGNQPDTTTSTTGNTVANQNQVSNQGEDQNIREQEREEAGDQQGEQNRVMAQNTEEMKQQIQERKQEMNQELEGMPENEQKVYRNQNMVREAVHNLLDMKDLLDQKGDIGQQVSEVAKQFNNSVQVTLRAEEKVQTRSRFMRILVGGDDESADEIQGEVTRNMERIEQLKQLKEQIQDDEEIKQMCQEQIRQMEQEQNRLQELAQNEKQSKGLFGWLFKK